MMDSAVRYCMGYGKKRPQFSLIFFHLANLAEGRFAVVFASLWSAGIPWLQ